jgi:hypothetical protein
LQAAPRKRSVAAEAEGLAAERARFRSPAVAAALRELPTEPPPAVAPLPDLVGVVGTSPVLLELASEVALRGRRAAVVWQTGQPVSLPLGAAVRRGRVTPLEADEARRRVELGAGHRLVAPAGLVVVDHPSLHERLHFPRTVTAVPAAGLDWHGGWSRPGRVVGLDFPGDGVAVVTPGPQTDPVTAATLVGWLRQLGWSARLASPSPIEPSINRTCPTNRRALPSRPDVVAGRPIRSR